MPEPKRLGEFSPEFAKDELGLINQVRTERKSELSDYIATERPQLKRPDDIPSELDLVRQVMAGRKKEAPIVKERGVLGELAAGFGRGALGVVAAPAEIADVAGEAIGWEALEKAGEAGVKAVEKYIEESPKLKRTESISKNILKNPELWKDPRWYSSIVGEGLPTILSMVVPGMAAAKAAKVAKLGAKGVRAARIAGGLSAGVGLEAAGAASDVRHHEEQTGEEIPISTKLQSVLGTGIVAGSLEYVPIFAIFGKTGAKKLVGSVLSGMALEGTTEGAQGLIANAFAKAGYDADRNMVDGVVESIVGGVLLGGGMGAVSRVTNFKERVDETNPDEVSDILEQVEKETKVTPEKTIELTEAEKRQAAIDIEFEARRTPEERQAEIEAAMPATPMTTISEETTKLAEEGIKPEAVEPVPEEIVPEKIPLVPEAMPATLRAMGMKPVPVEPIVEKPIIEEKIVEPEAPKIEIPTLTDTTQAMAFGEKATPEQITELKRLRKESEARYDVLVKEDKLDEAGEEAFKAQLYREAFEAKEKPKEPEVVEKEPWEMTVKELAGQESDWFKEKQYLIPKDKFKKIGIERNYIKKDGDYYNILASGEIGDKVAKEMLNKNVQESIESHRYYVEKAIKEGKPVPKEVLAEYPDLAPAKPVTPKPPEPTPPEVVREEIEAEPIPEVAPKVEIDQKTWEDLTKKEFEQIPLSERNKLAKKYPLLPKVIRKERLEAFKIAEEHDRKIREKIEVPPKKEPTKPEPGFAWIKGKQKPILSARKITKGKNKGKYEVVLTKGRDAEGNIIPGAKKIVTEKHIITMPEEKIEVVPIEKVKVVKPVIPGVRPKIKKEEEPLFLKRKTATAIGVSKAPALQSEMDKITLPWKNAPIVEVVQAQSELPDVILKASKGEIVDGVYYKGKVYIVADNTTSPKAAVKTLLHESFGHYGMRELLGKDFGDIMNKVYIAKRAEVIKIADEYGYDIKNVKDRALAADEWLAREAVSNPESSWVQKVIAAIRQFVRRIMPSLKLSNIEIQRLMEDARSYVERGRARVGITGDFFEEPGYQVRAFHGGPSMFDKFRIAKIGEGEGFQAIAWGMYFTDVKDIAKGYAERLALRGKTPKERYLYQVTLHKGKEPSEYDWLTWDKFITPETKDKVLKQLKKEFPEDAKFMVSWDMSYGEGKRGLTGKNLYRQLIEEIANTKNRKAGFEKFRPSDKEASLFLLRAGIDGVKYPAGTVTGIETKGFNYVVFDEETVSIDERIAFAKRKPAFKETTEPIVERDYIANRKAKKDVTALTIMGMRNVKAEVTEGMDKFFGAISTRLGNVSPKLKAKVRRLDFDTNTKYATDIKAVEPLLKKAKKMSRNDFADWDYARKNSDTAKINKLINKYNMRKEYEFYRKTLDSVRKEAIDVGLEMGEIQEYAPRILKDPRGFLTAIGKAPEWPIYSRKIQERAQEMGIPASKMPADMRADIISNMILGGFTGLGSVPATKQRQLKKIPASLNRYYMDSDAALMQHLFSMRNLIETRKFFGKIPKKVAEMRTRLYAAQTKIREINKFLSGEVTKEEADKLKKRLSKHIGLEKEYTAYLARYALQRDYTENIGAYVDELIVNKEILPEQERIVNEILNARFHEKGTRGLIQAYKNISYIDTMGSPISALTQIGDLAWSLYEGGVIRTLKYAYKAARGKSRITKEDVGVERIAQEFADSGTFGKAVSKVFKIVGLEKIDTIGKEALLNTALDKYQRQAKVDPLKLKKEIKSIFEGETDSVIEDLVNNKTSNNVKLLVYSRLLDFQPVALSEMPQKYLDAGNGRLFYMLKTFTLKVFDVFRNESYNKIKTGDRSEKIQGMKNLARLSMFFILANAGADELKDLMLGRKTDFEDRVVDNVLRLFGVSKFVTWKARTEGVGSALARQILPPFKFIDSAGKDIITAGDEKGLEVIGSIPVVGKLAYWHIGRGTTKRGELLHKRLRKKAKEMLMEGIVGEEIERLHNADLLPYPGMPAKHMTIAGKRFDFDEDQYNKLVIDSGMASKKRLDSLVGTSYWKMLSDKEKASRVQRTIKSDRKKARNVIKRGLGVGAIPGMVPWKTTKKRKRPAWQEPVSGKKPGWQKSIGF